MKEGSGIRAPRLRRAEDFMKFEHHEDDGWEDVDGGEVPDRRIVAFFEDGAAKEQWRLTGRAREKIRTNDESILETFHSLKNAYTCCSRYCLHMDYDCKKPYLLETTKKLRRALARLTIKGQQVFVYELLQARWGTWHKLEDGVRRSFTGLHNGYGIPEVHGGRQICKCVDHINSNLTNQMPAGLR
jgi:hypothetical protein